MRFGDLAYSDEVRHIDESEIYDEDDTFPKETDDYELSWARRRLRKCLRDHEC